MSLVAIAPTQLWFDPSLAGVTSSSLIDANGEKFAMLFQAPKSGSIDRVCFRTNVVTTGETVDVRVETIGDDGNATGTLWGANTNAAQVIDAAQDNTWFEVTLTAPAVVARGDFLAVVIALPAAGNAGSINLTRGQSGSSMIPATALFTTTWAKSTNGPVGAVRYTDGTYPTVAGMLPGLSSSTAYGSTTNPDERGNKITIPFDCKVSGVWWGRTLSNAGDVVVRLYDAAGTVLTSKAIDGNQLGLTSTDVRVFVHFDTEVTLNAGDVVRVTLLPTTSTTTTLYGTGAGSAAVAEQLPGGGAMVRTTRTDGGAWTDLPGAIEHIGLTLSAVDDGAGGAAAGFAYGFAG